MDAGEGDGDTGTKTGGFNGANEAGLGDIAGEGEGGKSTEGEGDGDGDRDVDGGSDIDEIGGSEIWGDCRGDDGDSKKRKNIGDDFKPLSLTLLKVKLEISATCCSLL